ncbi:MAG: hypothetical protein WBM17_06145, partial [Anaerolineales bacterium]
AVLVSAGLIFSILRVFQKKAGSTWILLLIWTASLLIGILAGIPILWQRYYLPLIPAGTALSAVAIGSIWTRIRKT